MRFALYVAVSIALVTPNCVAQAPDASTDHRNSAGTLEKMPPELETKFALSALPPHLRDGASVYLLVPTTGYIRTRKGTNGFSSFVMRTEWMWPQLPFRDDIFVPMSYDEEGSKKMMPVWTDVAQMRARGLGAKQVYDAVMKKFADGSYQKPAHAGISYMIAPLMRTYPTPNATEIATFSGPHYMFYAPGVKDADIGGKPFSPYPFILKQSPGPHDVIILLVGQAEKANILNESKDLLAELCSYRKYLCIDAGSHGH